MNIFDFILSVGLSGGGEGDGDQGGAGGHPEGGQNLPVMPQWASNLPDEITGTEAARNILLQHKGEDGAKIEVPVTLVKSYVDAKRAVSGMVTIPGETATAEQKAA
ncbi:hypothetical protein LCGC14_1257810, partial [marine sediment metagenome]